MAGGPLAQTTGDRGRKRRRWPWVLLIVLLLLVIAAAAYGLMRAMGAGGVAVPTVVGKSQAAAVTKLEEAGFEAVVQEEYSDKYEQGFVSRQAPVGGTKLRKGESVDIWVSQGQRDGDARRLQGLDARARCGTGSTRTVSSAWRSRASRAASRRARCTSRTRRPTPV